MITVKIAAAPAEVEECLRIRHEVFVVEQQVPIDLEHDEYDRVALHFLALAQGHPVGTARVLLKHNGSIAKIGRVAILASQRRAGIGKLLMSTIEQAAELAAVDKFVLEAQTHALPFYQRLGYTAYGEEFMDAGIPHRFMAKLNRPGPFPAPNNTL